MTSRKILVTGTAGFIGFHLAKKLLERGDKVIGLDNINDYYDVNLKYGRLNELGIARHSVLDTESNPGFIQSTTYPKHKFIKLDLADREGMAKLFEEEKFDAVMHLAAQAGVRYSLENPHAYIDSNVVGFLNILEGCRHSGVKNLSYASSSSVYGLNQSQPFKTTDKTEHQVSLYAATKKSNEMMAHTYSHLYGIQTTGLRFFTVYGPWGRPDMAPMLFTDAILNDRPIKVFNNGKMSRDFTYIDDIVDGIMKVIDNPAQPNENWDPKDPEISSSSTPYRLYNIGNNAPLPLMEFIETLENSLGKKAEKNFMPMQDGDVVSTYADVSGLMNDFGYKPDTKLADGISEFVKWYRKFYGDDNK
ncbi:NAD-dependent epimerase [Sulfurovum riftiae]|uniref:Capsule biosynthesis protein CapI n=1 Tax=Sulfurovum riftiae TaxID=1630136 RepID=A0A151CHH4_9BACT|nr:NAD-dependent epimerase [Sulfurovum riftiae]KYJ86986.1 capsule biosynthesis protein CapI [Sulfurovum riftiae]